VKVDKQELLEVLRTKGADGTADRVAEQLPDEIDTDRDGAALAAVGLDDTQLRAALAAGGYGAA
jgi:hypothetical protein